MPDNLPRAWAGAAQWRILETGFGLGLNFLAAWRAWKDDPQRPRLLHFVSIEASPVSAQDLQCGDPELQALARELAQRWWGLTPGVHRLAFEQGQVMLTLCVGEAQAMLREQAFRADAVLLAATDALSPDTLKAVARLCRRGTRLTTPADCLEARRALTQCGFAIESDGPDRLHGLYDPHWAVKGLDDKPPVSPARCVVIGAGIAGAAAAASLARRGWQVQVLDAASGPAQGAWGLPAGLLAPHQSPDDNLLSRLSRAGVRATLQQLADLLPQGEAWSLNGVLENRLEDHRPPPAVEGLAPWTRVADASQLACAGLPDDARAWWHEKAAWVQPGTLVRALLEHPFIHRRWHSRARRIERTAAGWQVLGENESELAHAELVVVCAAYDSAALLPRPLTLHAVRGQVSWGHDAPANPPFPLNGNGHLLPHVQIEGRDAWLTGSTYGRGDTLRDERAEDHEANFERLSVLSPRTAEVLQEQFTQQRVQAWSGVRCASADRRPLVGEAAPGLWVSIAMGSRGLSFGILAAELLAARLHGEPLPLERKLADALDAARQLG